MIEVAKQADLSQSCFGDVETLAAATSCSWRFAKNVLKAVHDGTESDLLQRNVRCDNIKATDWPNMISDFVLFPENSRAVPGQEMVSICYSVKHPKYLLLKSKYDIALAFK